MLGERLAETASKANGDGGGSGKEGKEGKEEEKETLGRLYFGACEKDPREMCREDVAWLRGNALVRAELRGRVWGGVYDLESGRVEGVE